MTDQQDLLSLLYYDRPARSTVCIMLFILFIYFILPLFNQVGKLRTSSHLQLRPGQDKAKQFDR